MTGTVRIPETPEVLISPRVAGIIAFGGGLGLHLLIPAHIFSSSGAPLAVGLILIALAVLLIVVCIRTLRNAETDFAGLRPTSAIVQHGPYRISRNPIYIGAISLYLGVALAVNTLWMLAVLPMLFLYFHFGVVLPEERFLEERFGDEYRSYKARVRRWGQSVGSRLIPPRERVNRSPTASRSQ